MKINNCLKILNLDTDYTIDNIETLSISTIKKAYHIMALELHPDKNPLENANGSKPLPTSKIVLGFS